MKMIGLIKVGDESPGNNMFPGFLYFCFWYCIYYNNEFILGQIYDKRLIHEYYQ